MDTRDTTHRNRPHQCLRVNFTGYTAEGVAVTFFLGFFGELLSRSPCHFGSAGGDFDADNGQWATSLGEHDD